MIGSMVDCVPSLNRLVLVVSLPFVFVRRDVNVSGMPEKRVLSLWRDGDFCIVLRGVDGGDVSNLNLVYRGGVVGLGREFDSKSAKRSMT